jgi:hypothetical protein
MPYRFGREQHLGLICFLESLKQHALRRGPAF